MVTPRTVVGTLGLVATGLATAAVVSPPAVLGVEPLAALASWLADLDVGSVLLAASILAGLYVAWAARSGDDVQVLGGADEGTQFDAAVAAPPERVTDAGRRTGADVDADVAAAASGDRASEDALRERLRDLAVGTLADERGWDRADARAALAAGTWTDDPRAAAFLAGADGPAYPFGSRVRLWLDPETERERRVRATVAAVRAHDGDHPEPGRGDARSGADSRATGPPRTEGGGGE